MARKSYIVAARRTALGRVGGLHRSRRLEDLSTPVVNDVLKDCGLSPARVERLILGNSSGDGNPARLVGLAAGLPENAAAITIDQQCASGLEAIVSAGRMIALEECDIVIAGGAEAISMAPWRVVKPRHIHQTPRFIDLGGDSREQGLAGTEAFEAGDALARAMKISRQQQDEYVWRTHVRSGLARESKRFLKEIVALRPVAEEARDQSSSEPDLSEIQAMPGLQPKGTLTQASVSHLHDGAAFVVIVSEQIWLQLGKPPALELIASAIVGSSPKEVATSAIAALRRLSARCNGLELKSLDLVEMSERSAAEAIALRDTLGISDDALNPDGGAIARGHPLGAAGAILVTRLFTRMARLRDGDSPKKGAAVTSILGGQGMAALFEVR